MLTTRKVHLSADTHVRQYERVVYSWIANASATTDDTRCTQDCIMYALEEPTIDDIEEVLMGEEGLQDASVRCTLSSEVLPLARSISQDNLVRRRSPTLIANHPLIGIHKCQMASFPRQNNKFISIGNPYEEATTETWVTQVTVLKGSAKLHVVPGVASTSEEIRLVDGDNQRKELEAAMDMYERSQQLLTSCGISPRSATELRRLLLETKTTTVDDTGLVARMARGSAFKLEPITNCCLVSIQLIRASRSIMQKSKTDKHMHTNAELANSNKVQPHLPEETQHMLSDKLLKELQKTPRRYHMDGFYEPPSKRKPSIATRDLNNRKCSKLQRSQPSSSDPLDEWDNDNTPRQQNESDGELTDADIDHYDELEKALWDHQDSLFFERASAGAAEVPSDLFPGSSMLDFDLEYDGTAV